LPRNCRPITWGAAKVEPHGRGCDDAFLEKPTLAHGYYWYNIPKQAGYPFLSLVEHTNFLQPEYFGGDHIIYIGDYLEKDHPNFNKTEDELLAEFLPHLKKINPEFNPDWLRRCGSANRLCPADPIGES
jgi:protoporphyrinogen oxidase